MADCDKLAAAFNGLQQFILDQDQRGKPVPEAVCNALSEGRALLRENNTLRHDLKGAKAGAENWRILYERALAATNPARTPTRAELQPQIDRLDRGLSVSDLWFSFQRLRDAYYAQANEIDRLQKELDEANKHLEFLSSTK
jgi:hypothetical protein